MEYDPTLPPMSAQLAKRLAEAADGLRDNKIYFLYARKEFPFKLVCGKPHATMEDAFDKAATELEEINYSLSGEDKLNQYGPYQTASEGGLVLEYDSLEIKFFSNIEGSQEKDLVHSMTINEKTDAILLNLSAFDKFFLPYYTRLYGVDVAQQWRNIVKDDFSLSFLSARSTHGNETYLINIPRSNQ